MGKGGGYVVGWVGHRLDGGGFQFTSLWIFGGVGRAGSDLEESATTFHHSFERSHFD